jgi:hypothetical protein
MKLEKIKNEIKSLTFATLYFAAWFAMLMVIKKLVLSEYRIEMSGFSYALIGALILAKVVLILEHVSLGGWAESRSALLNVMLRTALYSIGVIIVVVLEKSFEGRHEHGGFVSSLANLWSSRDISHVYANTIAVVYALLGYNILFVVRRHLGEGGLRRVLLSPIPPDPAETDRS